MSRLGLSSTTSKLSMRPSCCIRPYSPIVSLKFSNAATSRPRTTSPQLMNRTRSAMPTPLASGPASRAGACPADSPRLTAPVQGALTKMYERSRNVYDPKEARMSEWTRQQRRWLRGGLVVLAVTPAWVGLWATVSPKGFYYTFPGAGHHWVSSVGARDAHPAGARGARD